MEWMGFWLLAAGVPVLRAWWANRRTSLAHAFVWAIAAWLVWTASAFVNTEPTRYLALALTGCAGVAVLGARRPRAAAWHAVVVGLLAVLLMPLAQGLLVGRAQSIGELGYWLLAGIWLVAVGNYLPTRLGLGALVLLAAFLSMMMVKVDDFTEANALAGAAPWLAWLPLKLRRRDVPAGSKLWLDFRDRFGAVWALRVQDQFNRAAVNSGLDIELIWSGLVSRRGESPPVEREPAASVELLTALMTRFGLP